MANLRGNRGEWSEVYAFLYLLATGKIHAADEKLHKIDNLYFPINKIHRKYDDSTTAKYTTGQTIWIYLNDQLILKKSKNDFRKAAKDLLGEIQNGSGSFSSSLTQKFLDEIKIDKLKAPSSDKADIRIDIRDVQTGFEQVVGFSIKSELGSPPTLLNASEATNFKYKVTGLKPNDIEDINSIDTKSKIRDRIEEIGSRGGKFHFCSLDSRFDNNLIMIDSRMSEIISEMLLKYYKNIAHGSVELVDILDNEDSLQVDRSGFYEHKFKEFLCSIALGMRPTKFWDGLDEANGGYIIVKTDGEVVAYHLYNRDSFKKYLLNNTRFDTPWIKRHKFGALYREGDDIFINLNLQIRFT